MIITNMINGFKFLSLLTLMSFLNFQCHSITRHIAAKSENVKNSNGGSIIGQLFIKIPEPNPDYPNYKPPVYHISLAGPKSDSLIINAADKGFKFKDLPAGIYQLILHTKNYPKKAIIENIHVEADSISYVPIVQMIGPKSPISDVKQKWNGFKVYRNDSSTSGNIIGRLNIRAYEKHTHDKYPKREGGYGIAYLYNNVGWPSDTLQSARLDSLGDFQFKNIEPGYYMLFMYSEVRSRYEQNVFVKPNNNSLVEFKHFLYAMQPEEWFRPGGMFVDWTPKFEIKSNNK